MLGRGPIGAGTQLKGVNAGQALVSGQTLQIGQIFGQRDLVTGGRQGLALVEIDAHDDPLALARILPHPLRQVIHAPIGLVGQAGVG